MTTKVLVVLSGGQDSSTCCAMACLEFDELHAITFNYGQKHAIEIESAIAVGKALGVVSHELIDLGAGILKSSSPLVSSNPLGKYESIEDLPDGVEPTFIPGRNVLFLTIAANRAAALGINTLITGLCEEYWDCRLSFVNRMAEALGDGIYGNPKGFHILTPLMHLNKAQSVKLAAEVMGDRFDEIMSLTHTCYDGVRGGCGSCHACHLRDRGFREAGIDDPIWKFRKP
jgi:7-cyano-7-deazaguanine synthase